MEAYLPHLELIGQEAVGDLEVLIELAHALGPVHIIDGIARAGAPQIHRGLHAHVLQPCLVYQAYGVCLQESSCTHVSPDQDLQFCIS
jgi:hypothetical protein